MQKKEKQKKRISVAFAFLTGLLVALAIAASFFLWDKPNILIDVFAILFSAAALVAIAKNYKNKSTNGSTLGVFLVIATIFILALSVYYDVKKESPPEIGSIEISGNKIAIFFKNLNEVNSKCKENPCPPNASKETCNPCAECIGPTFLSRDWQNYECQAIKIVSSRLEQIRMKSLEDPKGAFNEFEIYRKEIIRKIEKVFEASSVDQIILKNSIAELIVLDQLTFNVIKDYIKP